MSWTSIAAVAAGSALGGALRFVLGTAFPPRGDAAFPLATLLINVAGSLLLGLLLARFAQGALPAPAARLALTAGFCGGFTTFSTFSLETVRLANAGHAARAAAYVMLSVALSLAATGAGLLLGRRGG